MHTTDTLQDALQALTTTGCGAIPVFPATDNQTPTGWITYPAALAQL